MVIEQTDRRVFRCPPTPLRKRNTIDRAGRDLAMVGGGGGGGAFWRDDRMRDRPPKMTCRTFVISRLPFLAGPLYAAARPAVESE